MKVVLCPMDTAVLGITRNKAGEAPRYSFIRAKEAFGQPGFDRDEYIIRPAHRLPVVREKAHRAVLFFQTFEQRRPRMRNADVLSGGQSGRNHPGGYRAAHVSSTENCYFHLFAITLVDSCSPLSETPEGFRTRARQSYCFPPVRSS